MKNTANKTNLILYETNLFLLLEIWSYLIKAGPRAGWLIDWLIDWFRTSFLLFSPLHSTTSRTTRVTLEWKCTGKRCGGVHSIQLHQCQPCYAHSCIRKLKSESKSYSNVQMLNTIFTTYVVINMYFQIYFGITGIYLPLYFAQDERYIYQLPSTTRLIYSNLEIMEIGFMS